MTYRIGKRIFVKNLEPFLYHKARLFCRYIQYIEKKQTDAGGFVCNVVFEIGWRFLKGRGRSQMGVATYKLEITALQ